MNDQPYDFEQDAGLGTEGISAADVLMPRLKLLQSNSNECKPRDPNFVPGAAEGKWLDTIRREVFDEFIFVPCNYQRQFVEWKPLEQGGGLVRNWGEDDHRIRECTSDEFGRYKTPEGHDLIPTPTYFGYRVGTIAVRGEPVVPCDHQSVLMMPGTAAKISARWASGIKAIKVPRKDGSGNYNPPSFYLAYKLSCVGQKNDKGSWVIPIVERFGLTSELYPAMIKDFKDFAQLTKEDRFKQLVTQRDSDDDVGTLIEGQAKRVDHKPDDEIPF